MIPQAIAKLAPGARWKLKNIIDISTLEWLDDENLRPTNKEILFLAEELERELESSSPDRNLGAFFQAIREEVTRPILNEISRNDNVLMLLLFNAFDRQNFKEIVEYWNVAIKEFPVEISEILNQEIEIKNSNQEVETKSRAEIAKEQARLHRILLGLDEDFMLFPLIPQEGLTRTELQKRLKELRFRGLTEINLNQSQEELEAEYLRIFSVN